MASDFHGDCRPLLPDVLLLTLPLPAVAQNPPAPTLTIEEVTTKAKAKAG